MAIRPGREAGPQPRNLTQYSIVSRLRL